MPPWMNYSAGRMKEQRERPVTLLGPGYTGCHSRADQTEEWKWREEKGEKMGLICVCVGFIISI